MYRMIFMCLIACFMATAATSQVYQDELTANFAYQVKQVNEFIERFNNNDKTLIKRYAQTVDPSIQFNRATLIRSLFNAKDSSWDKNTIIEFINCVTDSTKPVYLNFFDDNWFAQVDCAVTFKGKPEKATLILQIQKEKNNASKWIVISAKADFLQLAHRNDSTTSLNPISHAIDFMNIDLLNTDRKNIRNYLPAGFENDMLSLFIYECQNNRLLINQVNKITYHFLQVDGWIFQLRQFNRQSRNSGWLVSKLLRSEDEEKLKYKAQVLNIN